MNTALLENMGFTKGEIKVYLSLLALGNTTTGPLILKAKVARSKVYEILERLKEKGLITDSIKENTRYFEATSPKRIIDFLHKKQKTLQKQEQDFQQLLPELIAKQKEHTSKQEVKSYLGMEGMKTFFEGLIETPQKGEEYLAISFYESHGNEQRYIRFFRRYHLIRKEKKIPAKILALHNDPLLKEKAHIMKPDFYQLRATKNTVPTGVVIYNETVGTMNLGETPRVFSIICKENAEHYKQFFYDLWKKASPIT